MNNENGVTIMVLIITIAVLIIISSIVVYTGKDIKKNAEEEELLAELNQVHHIVLEEYNKKITLGDDYNYIGTTLLSSNESTCISNLNLTGTFYELTSENLKNIGAKNATSTSIYLVCYDTGTVINFTEYTATTDKANFKLYTK